MQKYILKFSLCIVLSVLIVSCNLKNSDSIRDNENFSIPLNLKKGYEYNQFNGNKISSFNNPKGNIIKTGTLYPIVGEKLDSTLFYSTKSSINYSESKTPTNELKFKEVLVKTKTEISNYKNNTSKAKLFSKIIKCKPLDKKAIFEKAIISSPLTMKENAVCDIQYLSVENGLHTYYVQSLLKSKKGLWIGTEFDGAIFFDGKFLRRFGYLEGLISDPILTIYEDKSGTIWFGTEGAGIVSFDGQKFRHFKGLEKANVTTIYAIIEDKENTIWFATNNGILKFSNNRFELIELNSNISDVKVFSLFQDKNNTIWFGTQSGLFNLKNGIIQKFTSIGTSLFTSVKSIIKDKNNVLWFASDSGLFKKEKESFYQIADTDSSLLIGLYSLGVSRSNDLWIASSINGVFKYNGSTLQEYNTYNGLPCNDVSSIVFDDSDHIWLGTLGSGIGKINEDGFTNFGTKYGLNLRHVWSAIQDKRNNLWFGGRDGWILYAQNNSFSEANVSGLKSTIISIGEDSMHQKYLVSKNNGIAILKGKEVKILNAKNNLFSISRTIVFDKQGNTWIATENGLLKMKDHTFELYTTDNGLISNRIKYLFVDRKDNLWICSEGGGISRLKKNKIIHYTEKEGLSENNVISIFEDKSGLLWIGTRNGGVNIFNGKQFDYYTEKNGLSNNKVWSFCEDKDNNIYAVTESGINKFSKRNNGFEIIKIMKEDGLIALDFTMNSSLIDKSNRFWAGNGKDLITKNLDQKTKFKLKPKPIINNIEINENHIDFRKINKNDSIQFSSILPFTNYPLNLVLRSNLNTISINYITSDWTSVSNNKYQFRLVGYEKKWNKTTENLQAIYRNIPDGNYTFEVRLKDKNNTWSKKTSFRFSILPPWYKTWWAYLLYTFLFVYILKTYIKFRTRNLKQKQIELEKSVAERTLEVVKEKQLVEEKNREILDSITYAKRIQSAILPQPKLVKEFLEDSFILYKPKDIVAGDFYWLEVVGDIVLFAAADCTGHGVPGAMVSVICNNGLNRAVREHRLTEPDQILNKTRELVMEEFEKSDEEVKDGMDISLCALNTKTNTLKWAGANNPVWILRNGEIIEKKGDKQPIGKHFNAKPFSLKEFQLEKDDIIYIFTDGFQDQFGGPKEKKFRVAQMRELFLSLTSKTMEEQRKIIDKSFEYWKGELEQVDDVCVIGVRV